MKLFISQPMSGRSVEELMEERSRVLRKVRAMYGNAEVIDSILYEPHGPVWMLGESIKLMDDADLVYFCKGWNSAKGCMVECMVAALYGIDMLFE